MNKILSHIYIFEIKYLYLYDEMWWRSFGVTVSIIFCSNIYPIIILFIHTTRIPQHAEQDQAKGEEE